MMNRRRMIGVSAAALLTPRAALAQTEIRETRAMGAQVVLRAEGATPVQARGFFDAAERALRHIEGQFSLFGESALLRLNRTGRLDHPGRDMLEVLTLAAEVHAATGGAFDPAVQPLWLARAHGQPAPDAARFAQVQIDARAICLPRGAALTLNGIAQGFAADRLADIARRHGLPRVLVDAGEMAAIGAWDTGIAATDGQIIRQLRLDGRALATSSGQGTLIGPERAPHIIDPAGGRSPRGLVSVSADRAALADALSTAFCVMDAPAINTTLAAFPKARIEAIHA
ncbi:MAG: FAD:protein FMN transferase [Paracoccus sp. (in: a-proteobacteria)]|nr:FAD:protein FMN transferase [Paracoccus sp. (in: a-proteobacteria)]